MKAFTIGRDQSNQYFIDKDTVSSFHAVIEISVDYSSFTLKDLNSANGTTVNGQEIASKKLKEKDVIAFGPYVVDTFDLYNKLNGYIIENRKDFSKEFNSLKALDKAYNLKKNNAKKYFKLKAVVIRMTITLMAIGLISASNMFETEFKTILIIGIGLIGTIISTAAMSENNLSQKLDDLYVEHASRFCCPKCRYDLSARSWNYWKSKEKCPQCKCIWVNQI